MLKMIGSRIIASNLPSQFLDITSSLVKFQLVNVLQVRHRSNKHWDPRWKKLRREKVIKIELPDYQDERYRKKDDFDMDPSYLRSLLMKEGIQPHRPWVERQYTLISTSEIFDAYIPPEGDGKVSSLTPQGTKQNYEWLKKKTNSWRALREIRKYEEDFELYPEFVDSAQEVYLKAHEAMLNIDEDELLKLVTEKAYPEIIHNTKNRTIRWKFIKSLEPPKVVHIRNTSLMTKENLFSQITVRFHTQQTLAIYDRFGRLIYGSEILAKDVLEYVVFEKQIANQYGSWRLHGKIIPKWMPQPEPSRITQVCSEEDDIHMPDEGGEKVPVVPVPSR